ncbi:hypothetical protein [Niastella populi]|uniref:Uncharacterized protein n=1 Tax=Niastella populi TaxID=550983 RepID=A0A1V9F518_9BACT|nr:hypothetical protein [Niastella populi]OQP53500.1 hypothetical protein A4R26_05805 [Niastella populi]
MEPLIYYPTFEPPNETWLKFALLYFENFKPIVPYNRRENLSDDFRRVIDKSDLVTLYSPGDIDGHHASLHAIEDVRRILEEPYGRSEMFKEINLARKWKDPKNWTFKIYKEKFSYNWVEFCQNHNIGINTQDGILLPEELAFIYMTYLAKEIAFSESAAIITDNNKFDAFTNFSRLSNPVTDRNLEFRKGIINLVLPRKLNEIPINKVIKFRRENRALIKAFNTELQSVQQKISEGYSEQDFIDRYNDVYSQITTEIAKFGIGITAIPFGMYALIKNPGALTQAYVKEVLGAMGFLIGGVFGLHKGLKDTATKRYCKKYITNLTRLQ